MDRNRRCRRGRAGIDDLTALKPRHVHAKASVVLSSQLYLSREGIMNTPKAIRIGFALVAAAVYFSRDVGPAQAWR